MPKNPPESTQVNLRQRLNRHADMRWPALAGIEVRCRAGFSYLDGRLPDGQILKLCRLRFNGVMHTWGFAIYLASSDKYEDNILPSGLPFGSPEEAPGTPSISMLCSQQTDMPSEARCGSACDLTAASPCSKTGGCCDCRASERAERPTWSEPCSWSLRHDLHSSARGSQILARAQNR